MKKTTFFLSYPIIAVFVSLITLCDLHAATLEVGVGKQYATIQSAIADANAGDTVLVDDGNYIENINFLGKAITVKSVNGAIKTIIDGNHNGTVVTFNSSEDANSILDGFRLTNADRTPGSSYLYGGGIYCYSASPRIKNCIIDNNRADYGGGIYCELSFSAWIENCTIINNWAMSTGGGIYLKSSIINSISKCIISNNLSSGGAGLCLLNSAPSISNCFIVWNMTNYADGGGISCYSSQPKITNCTISDNSVHTMPSGFGHGGGIYCFDASSPTVRNSILWGNSASDAKDEIYLSENSSINITYSDIEGGWVGQGNIHSDPRYVNTGIKDPDYHLTVFSPCIDKGTSAAPADDIDNDPRPQGKGVDMGADEVILKCPVEEIYGKHSERTELLRQYRDNVLSKTPEGQEIIKAYYKFCPTIVDLLEKRPALKNKAKAIIDNMFPSIRKKVEESNKQQ